MWLLGTQLCAVASVSAAGENVPPDSSLTQGLANFRLQLFTAASQGKDGIVFQFKLLKKT